MSYIHTGLFLSASIAFAAFATPAVITDVSEVISALQSGKTGTNFELTGQVIIPPHAKNLPFTVVSDGRYLTLYDRRTGQETNTVPGDIVRLNGSVALADNRQTFLLNCRRVAVTGRQPLPPAEPVGLRLFLSGAHTDRHVAIRGVVKDILPDDIDSRFVDLALSDGTDTAYVYYAGLHSEATTFRSLQGAEVVATGIGRQDFGVRGFSGASLEIAGTNGICVLRQNFADPFDVPEAKHGLDTLLQDVRTGVVRKMSGLVMAFWGEDAFLMKTPTGGTVQVEVAERTLPTIGESVEVVGHLETDLIDLYLSRACWRKKANAVRFQPIPIECRPLGSLFTNESGSPMTAAAEQGKIFRIAGYVKHVSTDRHGLRQLLVADGIHSILVNCTAAQESIQSVGEGFRVEVTGVCVKDSDLWRPSVAVPKIRGIFLVVRSPDDIRVLQTSPWWTPGRLMLVLAVLLVVIATILIWNGTLRYMVARKSRALLREQAAKLYETLRIGERTQLAAELHDYLAQNLTVVALQMTAAQAALGDQKNDIANYVDTAARMLKSCRTDLRRCLWDLRSDVLDEMNFTKAIEKTVKPIVGKTKLSIRFKGKRSDLSDSTAHAVLSILRELAANAVNHGNAQLIRIAGECLDQGIRFSITDDGFGFDINAIPNQDTGHFGLDGIRERLNRLGGTLSIDSQPGRGTYVRLAIPSSFDSSHIS